MIRLSQLPVIAPIDEPVTIAEVRMQMLNPEITTNDAEILGFIQAAREVVEHKLGRALLTQTWDGFLDYGFPSYGCYNLYYPSYIELPMPPLQSVTSITYLDSAGASTTLATTEYMVDTTGLIGRIRLAYGKSWPSTLGFTGDVTIRFVAGYTSADAIPASIKNWIKMAVAESCKNRDLTQEREPFKNFAEGLLDRYRILSV